MTETSPEQAPVSDGQRRGCLSLFGCGVLILLVLGLGFAALEWAYGLRIDAAEIRIQAEIATFQESLPLERPPFEGPGEPGNATWDYAAIEWVLGSNPVLSEPPESMSPIAPFGRDHPTASGVRLEAHIELLEALSADLSAPVPEDPAFAKAVATYAPLTAWLRRGLRREGCRWDELRLTDGFGARVPNLLVLRLMAWLMAYEAREQAPREALTTACEIAALGRDVGRHPSVIGLVFNGVLRETAERVLRAHMPRASAADLRHALARLPAFDRGAARRAIEAERLGVSAGIIAMVRSPEAVGFELPWTLQSDIFVARELEAYEAYAAQWPELVFADPAATQARVAELRAARSGQLLLFKDLFDLDVISIQARVLELRARHDILRLELAARIHELELGQAPSSLEELEGILGELPRDAQGQPYSWTVKGASRTLGGGYAPEVTWGDSKDGD